jgi:hypothetical protein
MLAYLVRDSKFRVSHGSFCGMGGQVRGRGAAERGQWTNGE